MAMADWNTLFDEARRQAGEQFEAAWKLHVDRVAETLETGWRENIARVVEQRFQCLKDELTEANEQYLAHRVESDLRERLNGEWHARLAEHQQQALDAEFERRVEQELRARIQDRVAAELAGRLEETVRERVDAEVTARLETELASRIEEQLPLKVEQEVQERLNVLLPARVEETVAERLRVEIPERLARERASWDEEFMPMVDRVREETRLETAENTREAARRELGLQLSQGLRVFRQATDGNEWKEVFLDAVQPYCSLCALFLVTKDRFSLEGVRGMAGELETGFELEFEEAAAFQNSLESKDVVVAVRSDSEVSPYVMSLRPDAAPGKCFLFPVLVQDVVAALLYLEPGEQPLQVGAVETLVIAAGLALGGMRAARALQTSSLVNIASAINPVDEAGATVEALLAVPAGAVGGPVQANQTALIPERSFNWDDLSHEQRDLHMRAQRFARVQVAEMRLYKDEAVRAGRRDANLYTRLQQEIDEARLRYQMQFLEGQNHMRDYLHG
ncbi:MAG: hypothetical protein ACK5ZU_10105, partial [Acidobacteriota bacterium]